MQSVSQSTYQISRRACYLALKQLPVRGDRFGLDCAAHQTFRVLRDAGIFHIYPENSPHYGSLARACICPPLCGDHLGRGSCADMARYLQRPRWYARDFWVALEQETGPKPRTVSVGLVGSAEPEHLVLTLPIKRDPARLDQLLAGEGWGMLSIHDGLDDGRCQIAGAD